MKKLTEVNRKRVCGGKKMKQKRLICVVIAELSSAQLGNSAAAVHYIFPIFPRGWLNRVVLGGANMIL
jgi:hypothetical protein